MTDFQPYLEAFVPTNLSELEFTVRLRRIPEIDPETGESTGMFIIDESLSGHAVVCDQNDIDRWIHSADCAERLEEYGVVTADGYADVMAWIYEKAGIVQALVLQP